MISDILDIILYLKNERTTMFKLKMFFEKYKVTISLLVILCLLGYIAYNEALKRGMLKVVEVQTVTQAKEMPKVETKCSKTEIEYVLKNEDNILKGKDFLVLDLNTFKVEKTIKKGGKIYTYYNRYGKDDIYLTIAKDEVVTNK